MSNQDIFKKFGQSARHILISSQRIAKNMNSGIGTEHLLLALTITAGNLAYDILKENAVSLDQVKMILSLNNIRTNLKDGLSREVKDILKLSVKKTLQLKHTLVESEHVLWAILASPECRAYQVIKRIGVNPDEIKEQIEDIFHHTVPGMEKFMEKNPEFMPFGPLGFPKEFGFIARGPQEHQARSTSQTPYLNQYGNDLTKLAQKKKLDPVIGREEEIARTMQILCRRTKNNPVLVGEPGVGKTAIVEGLAQKIHAGQVPINLKNKRIINLDLTMTVAGTMYRGQFEDRIKKIIQEVTQNKNIILFIDELHTVIGAGSAEGSLDAANILKPNLAKGQIRLIGATTIEEYRKHIEKDAALERRLQIIKVNEPTNNETIQILKGLRPKYEEYHQVKISHEAIETAVELSSRYISDRFLPDKAIDLIDEAAAAKQIMAKLSEKDSKIAALREELESIFTQKEKAAVEQHYRKAAQLKTEEINLQEKINALESKRPTPTTEVKRTDIAQVVSSWTSIPLDSLIQTEKKRFLTLEKRLKNKIIGQDEAVNSLAQAVRRSKSGVANPNRPIGTFIFLGPTGVGKTELAKVLAEEVFTNPNSLIKIDMSEFMEKHNLSRLVGAPPGYVGYDDAGKLTETVRRNPYSVILLDEIEKAHPEIFNILLQILEDGYLSDAKGRRINFRNTIIIMTSNIGSQQLNQQAAIGFQAKSKSKKIQSAAQYAEMKKTVLDQLKKEFRPEFLNRIDKTIVFKPLDNLTISQIVDLQINDLTKRLKKQGLNLEVALAARQYIAQRGFEPKFGARPIRRLISELIENKISDYVLAGNLKKKDQLIAKLSKEKIILVKK